VLECRTAEVKDTARILSEIMEGAFKLDIPLGVEVRSGQNWEDMKAIKVH